MEFYKERNYEKIITIQDDEEEVIDLSEVELIVFEIRNMMGSKTSMIRKTNEEESEIEIIDEREGECKIKITPEDTEDITPKEYKYEVMIEKSDGKEFTVDIGDVEVKDVLIK